MRKLACACNKCTRNIEFTEDQLDQMIACPHCGLDTILYNPEQELSPPLLPPVPLMNDVEVFRLVPKFDPLRLQLGLAMNTCTSLHHRASARSRSSPNPGGRHDPRRNQVRQREPAIHSAPDWRPGDPSTGPDPRAIRPGGPVIFVFPGPPAKGFETVDPTQVVSIERE